MKLSEIKEQIKNGSFNCESIYVRNYIPFLEKKVMVEKIIAGCIYEENGYLQVDLFDKQLFTDLKFLSAYFDIEDDVQFEELIEIYDLLIEHNYLNPMKDYIGEDWILFIDYLDKTLNEKIKYNNSLEGIVAKGINRLIDKLPDEKGMSKLIKDLPKQINKIDPNNLKFVSDIVGWNNGTKKPEGESK